MLEIRIQDFRSRSKHLAIRQLADRLGAMTQRDSAHSYFRALYPLPARLEPAIRMAQPLM